MKRTATISVYRTIESAGMDPDTRRLVYRWTHWASNGRVVGASTQGYNDVRDLTNNLILSHPGCWIRSIDSSPQLAYWDEVPEGGDFTIAQIPIDVPAGVKLARRNR